MSSSILSLTQHLKIENLRTCMSWTCSGVQTRWHSIGLELDIHPDYLEKIEYEKKDCEAQLRKVYEQWLKGNVINDTVPTMNILVQVIGATEGGNNRALANEIKKKFEVTEEGENDQALANKMKNNLEQPALKKTKKGKGKSKAKSKSNEIVTISKAIKNKACTLQEDSLLNSASLDKENAFLAQDAEAAPLTKDASLDKENASLEMAPLATENVPANKENASALDDECTLLKALITEKSPLEEGAQKEILFKKECQVVPLKDIPSGVIITIIVIRKQTFNSRWLQAISPKINLSCRCRKQVVKELELIRVGSNFIQIYDCITRDDISIDNKAYREDIEKLQEKCPNPDLVLFCTPLINQRLYLNQRLYRTDQQKVRNNDINTIDFFSKICTKKIWMHALFVLSKEDDTGESSNMLKSKILGRCRLLKERIKATRCPTSIAPLKYACVENKMHEKPTWKADIISDMCRCCTDKARPVLQSCLDDRV